jgi:hypothetical protein
MSATGGDYADNLNILGRSLVYSSGSGRNCQAAGVILDRGCLVRSSYKDCMFKRVLKGPTSARLRSELPIPESIRQMPQPRCQHPYDLLLSSWNEACQLCRRPARVPSRSTGRGMSVCLHMRPDGLDHLLKVDIVDEVDALLLPIPRRSHLTTYVRLIPIIFPIRVTGPGRHPAGVKGIGVAEGDHFKIMACAEQLCQEDLHMDFVWNPVRPAENNQPVCKSQRVKR